MTDYIALQKQLKYQYENVSLLQTALTHRSFLNESHQVKESYERLEFLGDAVLELVTSNFLYHQFPQLPEGQLTSLRSKIVQTRTLAAVAKKLNLGSYLMLSKGELASGGAQNSSLLADLLEAVIGSIYLDSGLPAVTTFLNTHLLSSYQTLIKEARVEDFKSKLQEIVQAKGGLAPTYRVIKEVGPDHDRIFTIEVTCFDTFKQTGTGKSKQSAEQNAAKNALKNLPK